MFAPVSQAKPAVVVVTGLARHVHAPFVLFGRSFALGAGFGVGHQPSSVLRVTASLLLLPLFDFETVGRPVVLLFALDAESITTSANNTVPCDEVSHRYNILTPLLRTPLNVLVILSVSLGDPVVVLRQIVVI